MMTKQPDTAVWICSLQHSGALPVRCSIVLSDVSEAACFSPPLLFVFSFILSLPSISPGFLLSTEHCIVLSHLFFSFLFLNYESQQLVTCL